MDGIGKKELVRRYVERYDTSRADAERALTRVCGLVHSLLLDLESVRLTGIGTLYCVRRDARKQVNNLTGENIKVPQRYYVHFKPIRGLPGEILKENTRRRRRSVR